MCTNKPASHSMVLPTAYFCERNKYLSEHIAEPLSPVSFELAEHCALAGLRCQNWFDTVLNCQMLPLNC